MLSEALFSVKLTKLTPFHLQAATWVWQRLAQPERPKLRWWPRPPHAHPRCKFQLDKSSLCPLSFNHMVESNALDHLFMALADGTRRSILERAAQAEMSIGEIAQHYSLTFAAVSKHIKVLERANLITKRRRGKEQVVIVVPETLDIARHHLERYTQMWQERFDNLDLLLKELEDEQNASKD